MKVISQFDELAPKIIGCEPSTARPWAGGSVVISDEEPFPSSLGFDSDPNIAVTPYLADLIWLFEKLRDVVIAMPAYFMSTCPSAT